MDARRTYEPRWTMVLAMTTALCAFPAQPVPAQEDPRPTPPQRESQPPPEKPPEQAEATTADAEILAQLIALDENEVNAARTAQQKQASSAIQRYAKMIEQDHGKDIEDVRALGERLGLTLSETATVDQLHARGQEILSKLAPLTGDEFGKTFVTQMVIGHREAIQMLDDFLKTAQNEEVKQHLTAVRQRIAMHLKEGERLQGSTPRVDRPDPSDRRSDPLLVA